MLFLFVNILLSVLSSVGFLICSEISASSVLYALLVFVSSFISFTILLLIVLAVTIICIPKDKKVDKNLALYRWYLCEVIKYAFIFLRVKYTVTGLEKIPENKRFLLVSNHLNESDPLFLVLALQNKYPISVIAKKDIWDWFFVPNAITGLGCIPIDRENDREAAKTIIYASKLLKEDKLSVAVFPEGYTEKGRGLLPFRDGVFKIAQRGNVPIVVSVIIGSETFFKNLFFRKNNIEIKFIDCIHENVVSEQKTHELGQLIHSEMEKELIEL